MAAVTTFEIHASDPAACIVFYEAAFGWEFVEHAFGDTSYWEIRSGEAEPRGAMGRMIRRHGNPPADGAPVMGAVITVNLEDLDTAFAAALAHGGVEAMAKFAIPGIGWVAYVKDPDGNVLGLFQSDGDAA